MVLGSKTLQTDKAVMYSGGSDHLPSVTTKHFVPQPQTSQLKRFSVWTKLTSWRFEADGGRKHCVSHVGFHWVTSLKVAVWDMYSIIVIVINASGM